MRSAVQISSPRSFVKKLPVSSATKFTHKYAILQNLSLPSIQQNLVQDRGDGFVQIKATTFRFRRRWSWQCLRLRRWRETGEKRDLGTLAITPMDCEIHKRVRKAYEYAYEKDTQIHKVQWEKETKEEGRECRERRWTAREAYCTYTETHNHRPGWHHACALSAWQEFQIARLPSPSDGAFLQCFRGRREWEYQILLVSSW